MDSKTKKLAEEINSLKKERNALILVHNYQRPEIYEIADFLGDSLDLSKRAVGTDKKVIVFCGVEFMAETAKILNPDKTVLLPRREALCPLADAINVEQLRELKNKHPGAVVVSYINTTAAVKAESDYCCTSINAVKIVQSLKDKKILFVPDMNLGKYIEKITGKKLVLWEGYCYVHGNITKEMVEQAKKNHPDAKVVAHPECREEVLKLSDHITGTGGMITYAKENHAKEFIIATESGMVNRLKREVPDKEFYSFGTICFNQKSIHLEDVKEALEKMQHKIELPPEIIGKAFVPIKRMLEF